MKKISIIGTAGIPGKYGGFETLAEHLTKHIGIKLSMVVYCSSKNYTERLHTHNEAALKYIPLDANGMQSIPYDILSLFHAARNSSTILILGVSGCVVLPLFRLFYPQKKLIINIDGLEHKRDKWKKSIQRFLKYSEKLAIKFGDVIITDNKAIQDYILAEYKKTSTLIAYGGDHAVRASLSPEIKQQYAIPDEYAFKVCRIEPENNIHLILEAFAKVDYPLVLIGNWDRSAYGIDLKQKYAKNENLFLLNPIYDQFILDQIRSNCTVYIHGHSAGGTNPALVEAMNLGLPVFTFDCAYNRATTLNKALYFKDIAELKNLVEFTCEKNLHSLGEMMLTIAKENYTWEKVSNQYYEILK